MLMGMGMGLHYMNLPYPDLQHCQRSLSFAPWNNYLVPVFTGILLKKKFDSFCQKFPIYF